jgi:hypothetical protein
VTIFLPRKIAAALENVGLGAWENMGLGNFATNLAMPNLELQLDKKLPAVT